MARSRTLYLIIQDISAGVGGVSAGKAEADGEPVLAFDSQERAVAEACRLTEEARCALPPFYVGEPANWSRLGLKRLIARLERLGLRRLPKPDIVPWEAAAVWRVWWDRHGGELTPEQVAAVWKLFDKVELYHVVEVPLRD
jgi:hypothetical protein